MDKLIPCKVDRSSKTVKATIRDMTTKLGMTRKEAKRVIKESEPDQFYQNSKYTVSVFESEPHGLGDVVVWHLSIRRNDREPIHDWRDLQEIKTQICGAEVEALELYPAESRVMDAANQYHLYALMGTPENFGFSGTPRIPVGYQDVQNGRTEVSIGKSKQRRFDDGSE
jgi:hypothetical protein